MIPTPSNVTGTTAYDHKQPIDHTSITNKGDPLPPIPPLPTKKYDLEATVKHALPKGSGTARATVQREPSDEYDDYDEDFVNHEGQNGNGDTELPDTTLLDSVVLPALASVWFSSQPHFVMATSDLVFLPAVPTSIYPRSTSSPQHIATCLH